MKPNYGVSAVGIASVLFHASAARADEAPPIELGRVEVESGSVEIESQRLELDCVDVQQSDLLCTFQAIYHLRNTVNAEENVTMRFSSSQLRGGVISDAAQTWTFEQPSAEARIKVVFGSLESDDITWRGEVVIQRRYFGLSAGFVHAIGNVGVIYPRELRHPIFGVKTPGWDFPSIYLEPPISSASRATKRSARLRIPASWVMEGTGLQKQFEGNEVIVQRSETLDANVWTAEVRRPSVAVGGPLLGIIDGGRRGWLAQAGFEVGLNPSTFAAIYAEGSRSSFVITPMLEVASPVIFFIPSFGLGLGLPMRVDSTPDAGFRAQLVMNLFCPVALVGAVDYWVGDRVFEGDFGIRFGL